MTWWQMAHEEMYELIPTVLRRFETEIVGPRKAWETRQFGFIKQTGIYARVVAR